jgi:nucleoside-diphosphate-sugar epimerase
MQRVLVTGASGFVGGNAVWALRSQGLSVRCLVRTTSRLDFIKPANPELALGDVTDPSALDRALEDTDAVVHCAGLTRARSSREFYRVNEGGTQNLLQACARHKNHLRAIVFIGSLAAIGPSVNGLPVTEETDPHPIGDYGRSKLAAQRLAQSRQSELPICILVPPAIYGPRDVGFKVYFKMIARGFMPSIGAGERRLSLIYAEDLARAITSALQNDGAAGKIYMVDDGCIHTWTSVGEEISRALNRKAARLRIPIPAAAFMGAIGDLLPRLTRRAWLLNSEKVADLTQKAWICSSRRIREELDFQPQYPLEKGIRKTLAWYRENGWMG